MAFDSHILTADEILAAPDIEERIVDVPQWGGAVKIRSFSLKQVQDMRKASTGLNPATNRVEVDNEELEARMFTAGMIEPAFTFKQYEQLREKSIGAIQTIMQAIMEISGLTPEAVSDATKSVPIERNGAVRVPVGARAGRHDKSRDDGPDEPS
jgi:hypothetical protein